MDQIKEQMDRISELSPEELAELRNSVVSEFEAASASTDEQTPTRETVDLMNELADANDMIVAEQSRRAEEAQELSAAAAEAASRMKSGQETSDENPEEAEAEVDAEEASNEDEAAEDDKKDDDEDEDDEKLKNLSSDSEEANSKNPVESENSTTESVEEPSAEEPVAEKAELSTEEPVEAEATPEAELSTEENIENPTEVAELATEEPEPESSEEPVTASNTPEEGLDFQAPADNQPTLERVNPVTITASADLSGIPAGTALPGLPGVAQAILERKKGMGRITEGNGDRQAVARFSITYPENRTLSSADFEGNRSKVESVVSAEAITAAGGLTAPVETSYDIWGFQHSTARPIRDSLAVFAADRGGIRFMTPPVLSDLEGAVSLWTLQDDVDAAADGATIEKPCIRVNAGEEITVYTDAIPLCLTFGNLGARAYPELVERHTELAMVQHARYAETRLLTRIGSLSTSVSAASELGAARDFFVQVEQAAAGYRSRQRIAADTPLRVILPEWFKNALRADLTKQIPGDGQDTVFNLAEAQINRWFAARDINVTWHSDGETGQIFGPQDAGALDDFPDTLVWYIFSEGTFLFLDGGTLDLGLVRDSTLNATNDYKLFLETFEGVAKIGVESLRVTTGLAIKGSSSATTVVTG